MRSISFFNVFFSLRRRFLPGCQKYIRSIRIHLTTPFCAIFADSNAPVAQEDRAPNSYADQRGFSYRRDKDRASP